MDSKKGPKISDFGISKILDFTSEKAQTFIGTLNYMSPERIMNQPYSANADVWSLGVILYELLTFELPFPNCKNFVDLISFIKSDKSIDFDLIPQSYSSQVKSFLKFCLVSNPKKRQNSYELLAHKWFYC